MATAEIQILRLQQEVRRLNEHRLCWRNGIRLCDTDNGPNSSCGKPATRLWIEPNGDDLYFCGEACMDRLLSSNGGAVKTIGSAHGFLVFEFTPTKEDEE